jgi:hypothetical protein
MRCAELAQTASNKDLAMTLVSLSQNWMKLARELEHARALLDECPSETETKKRA